MDNVYYNSESQVWVSIIFAVEGKPCYDLTFFKIESFFRLYILRPRCSEWEQVCWELSAILDYLKKRLTEEQFREVEKFCFEYI